MKYLFPYKTSTSCKPLSRGAVSTGATDAMAPVNLRTSLLAPVNFLKMLKITQKLQFEVSFEHKVQVWHPRIKNTNNALVK